jgi:hypothetical protein
MIPERYRKDYTGEFVVTDTVWSGGKKRMRREWLPNPIENHHISGRAACIASSIDIAEFDFTVLQNHKGGLLGSKKLQLYGTGKIAKLMRLDCAVEKDDNILTELVNRHYYKNNTIYTTPKMCLKHPGVFYPIPYNPSLINEVILAYLAAFDGHQEVFLMGYNDESGIGSNEWAHQLNQVMVAYPATKFFHVGYSSQAADLWKNNSNFQQLSHREFIIHCDV